MSWPESAERGWFHEQYERPVAIEHHTPAYKVVASGSYVAACRCGCIDNDPALLVHTTWFDALDDARTILTGSVHGPAAGMENAT